MPVNIRALLVSASEVTPLHLWNKGPSLPIGHPGAIALPGLCWFIGCQSMPLTRDHMVQQSADARVFLFLQGPHGPFFHKLGAMLRRAGATVWRVGFNSGDRAFWFHTKSYIPYVDPADQWLSTFEQICTDKGVTDIVLYGDTRPIHAQAVAAAQARGIDVHVFEEGYMRPYWVTYERGGSNGHSRLMEMSCLLYTSPSPRDRTRSRMPSSA